MYKPACFKLFSGGGSLRERGRETDSGKRMAESWSLSLLVLLGVEGGWGRGGNIHFYFSQKPSSRRVTFIGWILNITWLPDGSVLSEALSGLVLTCPDKSAVYPTLFLCPKNHFLRSNLIFPWLPFFFCNPPASPMSHAPFLPLDCLLCCNPLCVCTVCICGVTLWSSAKAPNVICSLAGDK